MGAAVGGTSSADLTPHRGTETHRYHTVSLHYTSQPLLAMHRACPPKPQMPDPSSPQPITSPLTTALSALGMPDLPGVPYRPPRDPPTGPFRFPRAILLLPWPPHKLPSLPEMLAAPLSPALLPS